MGNVDRKKNVAILEVLLCAAMWSTAGIFIKLIPWNSFVIAAMRSVIAGTVVFLYMRVSGYAFAVNRRSLLSAAALGGTMMLFVTANKLTTAANAIVLQFTSPIFIMILSALFLGKRFSKADIIAVTVTMCGISLFFLQKFGSGGLLGNCVALGSGITFACYYITLGECPAEERLSGIVMADILTCLVGIPFMFATHPDFLVCRCSISSFWVFSSSAFPMYCWPLEANIARLWPARFWARWNRFSIPCGYSFQW